MTLKKEYLWTNFVASVWLLILYCGFLFLANMANATLLNQQFDPFAARVALWPIGVGSIELLCWLYVFRYRQDGSRIMAGTMGVLLMLSALLVPLLVSDLYDNADMHRGEWLFFLYVSISHLAYAFFGTEYR